MPFVITANMGQPAIERLYDAHAQALYAFLLQLTRSDTDTRDLLQEVFVKLARNPALLDSCRNERAYLLRLAHNAFIDLIRSRQASARQVQSLEEEQRGLFAPSPSQDEDAFRRALNGALMQLPLEQRTVVHLKLWEELTFEAIAATLDISPNTAASRYRYGLDKLRGQLRPLYEEIK